jgi:di/tricarboxylate transporter
MWLAWLTLSPQELWLLLIAGVGLTLIVTNRLRPDLVALLVLLGLGISQVLTPQQALSGFSASAVITIVGLFVITSALEQTGAVQWLADRLARLSGTYEGRVVAVFMGAGALLSLVMNNIAAGAVLLPAAVRVSRATSVAPSRVLIPLAFGTLLGGMATLFTTANIILSGSLVAQGQRGLTMLDFLPAGGAMVLTGMAYTLLLGRRLLPARESAARAALARPDLSATYQLAERLWELKVHPDSPLVGRTLAESAIGAATGATVLGIWHEREARLPPAPDDVLAANDLLLVVGREARVQTLAAQGLTIGRNGTSGLARTLPVQLAEVVVAPRAALIGQTLKQLQFRAKYGLTTVALWHAGRSHRTNVGNLSLEAGDALLMVGPPERLAQLSREPDFIVLDLPAPLTTPGAKALIATLITALVLLLSAVGLVPTAEAMLAGAAALVLSGCISMDAAYRAVEWRVVTLIAGMLPIGTALVTTGLGGRIGTALTAALIGYGPLALVVGFYLAAVLITQLVGGQVAALILGPIAVSAAIGAGVSPQAMGVAVAMACSAAFLSPVAHPVNVLMLEPGGYRFGDFLRIGAGQTLVCLLTLLLVMPLCWGL